MQNLFTWGNALPNKLANAKLRWSPSEVQSVHSTNTRTGYNSDTSLWNIVCSIKKQSPRHINIAHCDGVGYAEMVENGNVVQIALCLNDSRSGNIIFKAAEVSQNDVFAPYNENTRKGTILKAALIAFRYPKDGELQGVLTDLMSYPCDDNADDYDDPLLLERFGKSICLLSNNLYYSTQIALDIKKINVLRQADIRGLKNVRGLLDTTPQIINVAPPKERKGSFKLSETPLSDLEKSMVPQMPKEYVFPEWVDSVCEDIKMSSQFKQPMRNILLLGPAGTGKTKGAQAIAYELSKPYVKLTCQPDTDVFDLIGQMLPNTDKVDMSVLYEKLNLPTFDDVENDFENVFEKMFGKKPSKVDTPSDCYAEITKRMIEGLQLTSDFTFVESDFIKAVKNGWVVEIQEPTVIKRSAVLVALNSILENDSDTASITLPTGKVIKRHPESVIVLTTNANYEGCNPIQQSVLSRMDIVRSIQAPEIDVLMERVKAQTGFKDVKLLRKMTETVLNINQYCTDRDITDGVCGARELMNWAKKSILLAMKENQTEKVDESICVMAAFPTVIEKISQTPEETEEVITSVFQKKFDQMLVEAGRNSYMQGFI